jgi:hypothetical protein
LPRRSTVPYTVVETGGPVMIAPMNMLVANDEAGEKWPALSRWPLAEPAKIKDEDLDDDDFFDDEDLEDADEDDLDEELDDDLEDDLDEDLDEDLDKDLDEDVEEL